jgi:hypothetical protein
MKTKGLAIPGGSEVPKYPKNYKEGSKWATVLDLGGSDNLCYPEPGAVLLAYGRRLETKRNV